MGGYVHLNGADLEERLRKEMPDVYVMGGFPALSIGVRFAVSLAAETFARDEDAEHEIRAVVEHLRRHVIVGLGLEPVLEGQRREVELWRAAYSKSQQNLAAATARIHTLEAQLATPNDDGVANP